jgi:hypothetical protein
MRDLFDWLGKFFISTGITVSIIYLLINLINTPGIPILILIISILLGIGIIFKLFELLLDT